MVTRIAFVVWTLRGMSGSETVVYDIARKLNKKLYPTIIVSFEDGPVRKMYEALGAKVYVISKKKRIDFKFIYDLRRILLSEKIDVINPHHYAPIMYAFLATRFSRVKVVYTGTLAVAARTTGSPEPNFK